MLLCSQAYQGIVKIHIRELLFSLGSSFEKGGASSMTLCFTAGVWKWRKLTLRALHVHSCRGHLGAPTLNLPSCWLVWNTKVTGTELMLNVYYRRLSGGLFTKDIILFVCSCVPRQQVTPRNIPFLCLGLWCIWLYCNGSSESIK